MPSRQALSESDRRLVAAWAADCAERVLPLFEREAPHDDRPRNAIARARAFARGELTAAGEIARRFEAGRAAGAVSGAAAVAAARAAAQASGVAHMGAHALGAAAYAARAAGATAPDAAAGRAAELEWQLDALDDRVRSALRALPPLGQDPAGPLGPGLLARSDLGDSIHVLQRGIAGEWGAEPRRATPADADRLAEIATAAYSVYLPRLPDGVRPAPLDADYAAAIRHDEVWAIEADRMVAAYLVLVPGDDHLLLENIAVDPALQHRGLGRRLLRLAEDRARELGLGEIRLFTHAVMVENQRLYERVGYARTGQRDDEGFDRVFYAKPIGS